jgi:hypothetical protein
MNLAILPNQTIQNNNQTQNFEALEESSRNEFA